MTRASASKLRACSARALGVPLTSGALALCLAACSGGRPVLRAESGAPEYAGKVELPPLPEPASAKASGAPALAAGTGPAGTGGVLRLPGAPELQAGGTYVLRGGGLELEVEPAHSGRATRFALEGQNVLAGPDLLPEAYGTTFWPSPQSEWTWPPPAELDPKPYAVEVEGSTLVLKSEIAPALQLRVEKRYRLDAARRLVEVDYTLVNTSDKPRKVAPWEIHRVPAAGGLTFFPTGKKQYPQSSLKLNGYAPITWFSHDLNRAQKSLKSFADGSEGWLAYASSGLVLIKAFADAPEEAHAPGEGEIELYAEYDTASKRHRFVELEMQGAYVELPAGGASTWNVRWFLRKLPASIAAKSGNPELTGFVRGVIQ